MAPASDLESAVRSQLQQILTDPSVRQSLMGGVAFTSDYRDKLDNLDAQVGALLQDSSFGRVLNGPLWLSGASIQNGTVTAGKISVNSLDAITINSGSIDITGNLTAAATYPRTGAGIVLNSTALTAYQSDGVTSTFKLNVDGSGEIGSTVGSKITWTNTGTLTVPAAIIGSLTIANVGSGVFGGTYSSSSGTAKIQIQSTGITATNSGGTTTFQLDATTGAMTATGSFTIQSASSGARVVIDNAGGVEGKNSGGTSTFLLNAADGSGRLGISGGGLSWNSSGTVSVDGSLLVSGTVTAGKLSVSNLAAINANLGTVTAGTINASLLTVSNLTATNITSGSLGSGAAGINIGGTNGLTVTGTITATASGGGRLNLDSGGSAANLLVFQSSSVDKGRIYADSSQIIVQWLGGGGFFAGTSTQSGISISTISVVATTGSSGKIDINTGTGTPQTTIDSNGDFKLWRRLYPGNAVQQSTGYLAWDGTNLTTVGADLYVQNYVKVAQSGTTGSGALPSPTKWLAFKENGGTAWFVPAFSAANAWTA